jgi:hypothetical protein
MYNSLSLEHSIQRIFTDRPELRAYFYEGKEYPRQGEQRAALLNIAEMLADAIDYGLMFEELSPEAVELQGWRDYAVSMTQTSPVLRDYMAQYPEWIPMYTRLVATMAGAASKQDRHRNQSGIPGRPATISPIQAEEALDEAGS